MCNRWLDIDEDVNIQVILGFIKGDAHVMSHHEMNRLALKVWVWIRNNKENEDGNNKTKYSGFESS